MMYVQRDGDGNVKGVYTAPQPQADGSCLTDPQPLSEDHPHVQAFYVKLKTEEERRNAVCATQAAKLEALLNEGP